jgi:hypothetical protein
LQNWHDFGQRNYGKPSRPVWGIAFALGASTMKKQIRKLALTRETIKVLLDAQLAHVAGGEQDHCEVKTVLISGCAGGLVAPVDPA